MITALFLPVVIIFFISWFLIMAGGLYACYLTLRHT